MVPRTYQEQDYCHNKTVSCIKFHPTKPYLVALSLTEHYSFDTRCEQMGKSFTSHVLILNFKDEHIITLNYVLTSPVEVTCIEFHPENQNVLFGGGINGQLIVWDIKSVDHRITANGRRPDVAKMPDEEEDKTQQVMVKVKELKMSHIDASHKSYVSDIKFIPGGVKVDKKHKDFQKSEMFISCSEDGFILIWDSKAVEKDKVLAEEQ